MTECSLSDLRIDDDEHRERMEIVGHPCDCNRCIGPDGKRIPSEHMMRLGTAMQDVIRESDWDVLVAGRPLFDPTLVNGGNTTWESTPAVVKDAIERMEHMRVHGDWPRPDDICECGHTREFHEKHHPACKGFRAA